MEPLGQYNDSEWSIRGAFRWALSTLLGLFLAWVSWHYLSIYL